MTDYNHPDYNHSLMCSYGNNYSYNEEELKELESENASIQNIYFPMRVFNSLKSDNVYTIKDLMSKSESELFRISGLGRKGVDSIKEEFNKINKAIDTDYYIGKKQTNRKDSMIIDKRSDESVYITINGWVYYIDDSTGEQIIQKWKEE